MPKKGKHKEMEKEAMKTDSEHPESDQIVPIKDDEDVDPGSKEDPAAPVGNSDASEDPVLMELAKLMAENEGLKDQLLRTAAEFENYRKRVQREKEEYLKYASEGILRDFLAVADNMENAMAHLEKGGDYSSLKSGVEITLRSFFDVLEKKGVVRLESTGKVFDPSRHEAIHTLASENVPAGHIISEARPGYMLNGRLLRPAMVVVSSGMPEKEPESEEPKTVE